MLTAFLTGAAGAAIGVVLGLWTRRTLAALNYRLDDEQHLPTPGPRRWIIWVSALSLGSIGAWLAATGSWALAPILLPLALTGPVLAAIDLDVMRLPNRILVPVAVAAFGGLASTVLTQSGWTTALRGLLGGLIAGGTLAVLSLITHGGIGFGDVKLAVILGVSTGAITIAAAVWSLLLGSISALAWIKVEHRGDPLPYGPWLLIGAWAGLLLSGFAVV
ncbi:MAG: prepilin peptidase [Actinobacteria bacterium]|jgi:leader peptidase (prepilin peptidase)/N-methyltransferase|nr:prepilin peptidase [Actinomycetota bacterium]